ncbi:hypothetical protein E2I00_015095, partial [Balaenoptera physalus]
LLLTSAVRVGLPRPASESASEQLSDPGTLRASPEATANNRFELWKLGITHVLNAAHGGLYCQGSPDFYGSTVSYLGVPAHDLPEFDISAYFSSAADFIHRALSTPGAKVLVHCVVGVSRSATLVLAYLMLRQQLSLRQAVITVRQRRWVFPNRGFLHQLCRLDQQLRGLCHFATLALALLVLLEALAQVGTQKMSLQLHVLPPATCNPSQPLSPVLTDPSSFNFLPTLHITLEGQPTFQNGLLSLPSSCLTSNIHIHTYYRQTPARLPLLPAGPGAWLGLALTMPGDQGRPEERSSTSCFIIKLQSKNRNSIKRAETGGWKPGAKSAGQRRPQPGPDTPTGGSACPERSQWGMKGKAGSSLPPCPPTARWVSLAKPVAFCVPISLPGPGTAYQRAKKFFPVCTFPSYWLRGPGTVSQERHSFQAQHQTQVLVPLTSQLCRVSDPLSQLTPDTSHPTWVRPNLQRWPESCGMDSLQKQDLRRPKIHGAVRVPPYQPPTLASLQRLLWVRRAAVLSHSNEVDTGAKFYHGMPLEYYGIEADDNPFFDLSVYFLPVARYIRSALSIPQGRVLVHCAMGVSRSATVVLAFLMICENMTLVEAIQTVQAHRDICPNSGFLRQLQVLDNRLGRETGRL